ncbi:regulatory protein RecX [Hippea alviniae]|uniref:regulatory protein RecX n=1 Tax=Hippea alviniae TaxID=1279027 RepID=UPI0003B53C16|nr:regulatory protein RecX [Hippea alviniae]
MDNEALKYALRLLNRRDYTELQLREKLNGKGFDKKDIEDTILYLKEKNFLNDERFAENYIFFRLKNGYGKRRIRFELKEKGIKEEIVDRLLEDKEEMIEEYFLKKLKQVENKKNPSKKLFDALYRRGFDKEKIFELINKYNVRERNEVS